MNSSGGSLNEEGEILETEAEKAPPSLPSVAGPSIDRRSSRNRGSISPAAYHQDEDTRSSHSSSSRHESRDYHYRSNGDRPRGEKRRRSHDRCFDTRQHKVYYEGANRNANHNANLGRQQRVSYADIDRSDTREDSRNHDGDERCDRELKRSRTHSRSPPRGPRGDHNRGGRRGFYDDNRRDRGNGKYQEKDRAKYENGYKEQSVSERADHPVHPEFSRRNTENWSKFSDQGGARKSMQVSSGAQRVSNGRSDTLHKSVSFSNDVNIFSASSLPAENGALKSAREEPDIVIEEPVDEAKLIEERRKMREAIKAKYRGQATPLLVSALGLGDSAPGSPNTSDSGNVPNSPLIQESREDTPNGTFTIAKDTTSTIDGDSPSAADYDPTMDMKEDTKRNEQRMHDVETSSAAYDETKPAAEDILLPGVKIGSDQQPQEKAETDDFDMFAEGDDDDMFAEPLPKTQREEPTKALPVIPQAKQLDASLLDNWDDSEGYYRIIPAELLDGRYRVQMSLGKGMFSGVVRALDMTTQKDVAIKIIRNNETMKKAGQKEIDILKKLCEADPEDKKHLVRLERYFEHKGHLCMVFENLSINLREVLKKFGRDVGINLKAVRAYAQQMFLGLSLMRKCNILHADLKPDNVLVNESRNILKICDLGSASDASENDITPYLVSRFYRAPEIILGMPYDFSIDMWSIGCTLYELYTGKILFTGRTNNQMLRSIMECRGKFSNKLLRKGQFTGLHFDEMLNFRSFEKDKITGKDIVKTMNFTKPTRELKPRLMSAASDAESKELNLFIDLLDKCLSLNPERRCTPTEALKHPFIYRTK